MKRIYIIAAIASAIISASANADTIGHYAGIAKSIPEAALKADPKSQAWAHSARTILQVAEESIAESLASAQRAANKLNKPLFCLPKNQSINTALIHEILKQNVDQWIESTTQEIKKYTNRPIKVRKKMPKKARGSRGFCDSLENIYCVVSLHTMAMTEALREGCPVISLVSGCLKDYSVNSIDKINNLYYPENRQYLFNCLTNLQFNSDELISGFAWNTISKYYGINITKI